MSHSLAKKFDKIVSKLANKHKDTKSNANDALVNHDELPADGNGDSGHESILQRMKGHLGYTVVKAEQHRAEGVPPLHVIIDDLKDSPFRGETRQAALLRSPVDAFTLTCT